MAVPIVFLSHSARDREVAMALKELLATHTKGEIEWWLSSDGQSIRGGKNWRAEVEKALRECKLVFILFTPAAQQSAWVQFEAGFAEALEKDIIPVALPGFDVDAIPGPLQHKQAFNLRGASGLNNILSVTNEILQRHDLLSLDHDDYTKIFRDSSGEDEQIHLLDAYLETIQLSADAVGPVIEVFGNETRQSGPDDLAETTEGKQVLAGPGFVLREQKKTWIPADVKTQAQAAPLEYEVQGDLTGSGLLELLPVFAASAVGKMLPTGVSFDCKLRKGIAVLTNQARILANMRGTSMRFADTNILSFGALTFVPRVRDANAKGGVILRSILRRDAPPDPYVPKDLRYGFLLQWESPYSSDSMKEFLRLLIERRVIFVDQE